MDIQNSPKSLTYCLSKSHHKSRTGSWQARCETLEYQQGDEVHFEMCDVGIPFWFMHLYSNIALAPVRGRLLVSSWTHSSCFILSIGYKMLAVRRHGSSISFTSPRIFTHPFLRSQKQTCLHLRNAPLGPPTPSSSTGKSGGKCIAISLPEAMPRYHKRRSRNGWQPAGEDFLM